MENMEFFLVDFPLPSRALPVPVCVPVCVPDLEEEITTEPTEPTEEEEPKAGCLFPWRPLAPARI